MITHYQSKVKKDRTRTIQMNEHVDLNVEQDMSNNRKDAKEESSKGVDREVFRILNTPWLLATVPLVFAAVWLANNPSIIADNLNRPYTLLAGPALVGSVIAGWLVFRFFRTIQAWVSAAGAALRKTDDSARFFWVVIVVFMVVSVADSGNFFTRVEPAIIPGIGYATALFIDLCAVQCMRARLNAVRMHDHRGAMIYLVGVFGCAITSAFANVYTSLAAFNQSISGVLPVWMLHVAPWFGLIFPALILLLSITADYTLDQTSVRDADAYKLQEENRVKLLEIKRDQLRKRVEVEREIDELTSQQKRGKEGREFFLLRVLFPRVQLAANTEQIVDQVMERLEDWKKQQPVVPSAADITNQIRTELEPWLIGMMNQRYRDMSRQIAEEKRPHQLPSGETTEGREVPAVQKPRTRPKLTAAQRYEDEREEEEPEPSMSVRDRVFAFLDGHEKGANASLADIMDYAHISKPWASVMRARYADWKKAQYSIQQVDQPIENYPGETIEQPEGEPVNR
jgi:hypothetical protein